MATRRASRSDLSDPASSTRAQATHKALAGLAIISAILSGLTVLTLAMQAHPEPIRTLENRVPSSLAEYGEATFRYSMVARGTHQRIQMRFMVLSATKLEKGDLIDPEKDNANATPSELLGNVAKLAWLGSKTAGLGLAPDLHNFTLDIEGSQCRFLVIDYSRALETLFGQNTTLGMALAYGAMTDDKGQWNYLEGDIGFFFDQADTIVSLTVSHNSEVRSYIPDGEIPEGSPLLPVSKAPKGVLSYEDTDRDDAFSVEYTARSRVPMGSFSGKNIRMIRVIKIYLDGRLHGEPIIDLVKATES